MRHFRILVAANGISAYGSYLNLVALNVFVYHLTESAFLAGLFMAVRLLTSVASGFVSGALVSRVDRKRLMIGADLSQATALVAMLLAPESVDLAALFGLALIAGTCSTLSQVALRSSIPEIVGAEHRAKANASLVTARSLAMIAGFASSGVVVSQWGYTAAFVLDAITFTVSALVLSLLPIRTRAEEAAPEESGPAESTGKPRWAALVLLRSMPLVALMIAVRAADGLGSSSHNVALPVYSAGLDPSDPAVFISQFWATWALGNIAAQVVLERYVKKAGRTPGERVFALGACVMSLMFILVFSGLPTPLAVAVALLAGMADGLTEIAYVSRLQTTPDEQRGRLFGLSASAENAGFGLGMLVSAALLERFTPFQVVAAFHGSAILLCAGLLVLLVRRGAGQRHGAADSAVPGPAAARGPDGKPRTAEAAPRPAPEGGRPLRASRSTAASGAAAPPDGRGPDSERT
ncbi:MFS transporter [Streptomyces sp. NPDC001922]|uniref:MFS transporter n=1 Tax=Streptomyces sp. NPDC001922 TaxID=3364624 RepID=UPI00367CDF60